MAIQYRATHDLLQEDDEFTKTDCYHYFHVCCLLRYARYHQQLLEGEREGEREREREGEGERERQRTKQRLFECPVCREAISCRELLHKHNPFTVTSMAIVAL